MAEATFEDHGLRAGIWHGRLIGTAPARLVLVLDGQVLAETVPQREGEGWAVAMPVPAEALGQGLRVLLLMTDPGAAGRRLAALTLAAGAPLAGDLPAEVAQLRAELDLLKQVVRRLARGDA